MKGRWRRWRERKLVPYEDPTPCEAARMGIRWELQPYWDQWRWSAWYVIDGRRTTAMYSEGMTRHHPAPWTVQGFCDTESEARLRLADALRLMTGRLQTARDEHARREEGRVSSDGQ